MVVIFWPWSSNVKLEHFALFVCEASTLLLKSSGSVTATRVSTVMVSSLADSEPPAA